ncbi:MAG: DUF4339 domain-containing protein [Verrucomicrobia bacterium]|nr:DUF4339 domain-containing protein [Verrucomicrobiota bacterium]
MASYQLICGDDQEYGPLTAEQVCQWLADGRIHARTQVKEHGADQWRLLSEFPDFAEALRDLRPAEE